MHALPLRRRALALLVTTVVLAGCAANKLVSHQAAPEYVGKRFQRVLVHAVAYDQTLQRVFEDRMVALLKGRGIQAIPAYSIFPKTGEIEEAKLREAIASNQIDGVLISRQGAEETATTIVSGGTIATGTGMVGLYGYYSGVWQVTQVAPDKVEGATWMHSSTRLFDAKKEALAWAGGVKTSMEGDLAGALRKYVDLVFGAMVQDGVI